MGSWWERAVEWVQSPHSSSPVSISLLGERQYWQITECAQLVLCYWSPNITNIFIISLMSQSMMNIFRKHYIFFTTPFVHTSRGCFHHLFLFDLTLKMSKHWNRSCVWFSAATSPTMMVSAPSDGSDDCLFSNTPLSRHGDFYHEVHHFGFNQIDSWGPIINNANNIMPGCKRPPVLEHSSNPRRRL